MGGRYTQYGIQVLTVHHAKHAAQGRSPGLQYSARKVVEYTISYVYMLHRTLHYRYLKKGAVFGLASASQVMHVVRTRR